MREKINQWTTRIGNVPYTVTIVQGDNGFSGSWKCPFCDLSQRCPQPATTRGEAAKWVNAETRSHHAQHHSEPAPG